MSTWTAPEQILNRGTLSVTWYRASPYEDIVIQYSAPTPPKIYPAGTADWWRPTSERWGQFLPDGEGPGGVAMLSAGLNISDEYAQVNYNPSRLYFDDAEPEAAS